MMTTVHLAIAITQTAEVFRRYEAPATIRFLDPNLNDDMCPSGLPSLRQLQYLLGIRPIFRTSWDPSLDHDIDDTACPSDYSYESGGSIVCGV